MTDQIPALDSSFTEKVIPLIDTAADAVLAIYETEFEVSHKDDASPLTAADMRSHEILTTGLMDMFGLPVLSEEASNQQEIIDTNDAYFIIDPVDGTKEFIKRSGDFTINVALYAEGEMVAGFIAAPATGSLWYAVRGNGAYFRGGTGTREIQVAGGDTFEKGVASLNHRKPADEAALQLFGCNEYISRGSSIKFCLVADGSADVYVRFGQTMVWDTAAADCIVREAGGYLYYFNDESTLSPTPNPLVNKGFVATKRILTQHQISRLHQLFE